jgi:hypothetical protein
MAKEKKVQEGPFKLEHISPKELGGLAMPNFCPRCFWIKAHLGFKAPFSTFPAIFSNIDSYSKKITTVHIAAKQNAPSWLMKFGSLATQMPAMHWSKFAFTDPKTGVLVRGAYDEMFRLVDGTLAILDYKTARFTEGQDKLLPIYSVQLSGYRWIAKMLGMGETSVAGLIYYEPNSEATPEDITVDGFKMTFTAHILPVQTDLDQFEHYIQEAKRIAELLTPPPSVEKCKDCLLIEEIRGLAFA